MDLNRVEKFYILEKIKNDLLELYEKILIPFEDGELETSKEIYDKVKGDLKLTRDIYKKLKAELNV